MPSTHQASALIAPKGLSEFQKTYSAFIRSPSQNNCPKGVPPRRSKVYEELVFNNTKGFIDKCFPVAKSLFTPEQWLHLVKTFFNRWSCHTPYFSQIPLEFVQYINDEPSIEGLEFPQGIPDWLGSLLHYEWIELEVELSENIVVSYTEPQNIDHSKLTANPTLMNLQYDWPVHSISVDNIPQETASTHLLVYRSPEHEVEFMQINALTCALINIFKTQDCTIENALDKLAKIVPSISKEQVFEFGRPLIGDLIERFAIVIQDK